jgi:hypothetical protein
MGKTYNKAQRYRHRTDPLRRYRGRREAIGDQLVRLRASVKRRRWREPHIYELDATDPMRPQWVDVVTGTVKGSQPHTPSTPQE